MISADDLLSCYNVFELCDYNDDEMVLFPVISADGRDILFREINQYKFYNAYSHQHKLREFLIRELRFYFPINSVGWSYSSKLIDKSFYDSMEGYKWHEDIPIFHNLIGRNDISIKISTTPYVIYRDTVGISKSRNHEKAKSLAEDNKLIREIFYMNPMFDKGFFNPLKYYLWIVRKFRMFKYNIKKEIKSIHENILHMCDENRIYFSKIQMKTCNYKT